MRWITVTLLLGILTQPAMAVDALVVEKVDSANYPEEIIADERPVARNGIPGGRIEKSIADADILEAWYAEPTGRYQHGILGDAVEAAALKVRTNFGQTVTLRLPRNEVFEDITPRLADLDGNGTIEVITIRSSVTRGAALTIYGLNGPLLVQKKSTPFIGRANRWLNVAAIADMTSGSNLEIAIVVKPHIEGTLQVIEYPKGVSVPVAFNEKFSNHKIGSTEQRLSATIDYDNDGKQDLIIPSLSRKILYVIGNKDKKLEILAQATLPMAIDKAIAVTGIGKDAKITVGLEDGSVYNVHR